MTKVKYERPFALCPLSAMIFTSMPCAIALKNAADEIPPAISTSPEASAGNISSLFANVTNSTSIL